MEHLISHWTDFREILYKGVCKFMIISSYIIVRIKIFQTIFVEEIKTHFIFHNFPRNSWLYEIMWKNMVERDRPQTKISGKLRPECRLTVSIINTSTAVRSVLLFDNSARGINFCIPFAKLQTLVFFTATSTPTTMKK